MKNPPQGHYHRIRQRLERDGHMDFVRDLVGAMYPAARIVMWPDGVYFKGSDRAVVEEFAKWDATRAFGGFGSGQWVSHPDRSRPRSEGVLRVNYRGDSLTIRIGGVWPLRIPFAFIPRVQAAIVASKLTGRWFVCPCPSLSSGMEIGPFGEDPDAD